MAFTVETGTGNSLANSYETVAAYTEYAADRGVTVGGDAQQHMILAFDYMNSWERAYIGYRTTRNQRGSFPRAGGYIDGWHVNSDVVPQLVKECQFELAMDLHAGIDLHNREFYLPEKKVKAGDVEVENAVMGAEARARESQAMTILERLFRPGGIPLTPSFVGDNANARFIT